jgi:uncharacterized ferritin-like protein (DUF455 family)
MRMESAAILKRFFFCEKELVRGLAGWIAAVAPLDLKTLLARFIWEDAETAGALRRRVFELRYPSRLMEEGDDAPLVTLYEAARHAPGATAYLGAVAGVLVPALGAAYRAYLDVADDLGDGPTRRFLEVAAAEKERQAAALDAAVGALLAGATSQERAAVEAWTAAVQGRLDAVGGITLAEPPAVGVQAPLPGGVPFALAQVPARDARFRRGRFYWPDNVDPGYPYGEGLQLQLRSAVSHLNEVWAVDTAGAILEAFAEPLGWEFVADAARWLYDEARHTLMGWTRLRDWGFAPHELPLGTFIYDAARDQDPLYRLAFLFFFETKNIGKKQQRAAAFASYGDSASQHDMDFDWADESIHASYGKRWLTALIARRGLPPETFTQVQQRCGELVAATAASATPDEIAAIRATAGHLIQRATALAAAAS